MSTKLNDFNQHVMDQRLSQLAAALPPEAPPPALRTRILDTIPVSTGRPQQMRLRLVAAGLTACITLLFLVAGPRLSGLRPASATEVHAAILRANTWHFVGWHLRNGQKMRWEVWGRRSPYLYREQIGDEVYLDDGTRSTHILPPDPKNGREHGVVLILPSQPRTSAVASDAGTGEANLLVGIGGDAGSFSSRSTQGSTEVLEATTRFLGYPTDTKEIATLTVDKATHLPVHYVVNRQESKATKLPGVSAAGEFSTPSEPRNYTEAELTPIYDVPLPTSIMAIQSPADYAVTDADDGSPLISSPQGSVVSQGGLTVHAWILAQDTSGALRLRFQAWLGKQTLNFADTGLRLDGLITPGRYGSDNERNEYIYVMCPGTYGNEDGTVDLWLVPAELLPAGRPAPTRLDLTAALSLSRYERMGRSGRFIPVTTQTMTFHLSLPTMKRDLEFNALLAPSAHPGMTYLGALPSLESETAEARASYYIEQPVLFVKGKMVTKINYGRAAYWWEAAAQAATRTGDTQRAGMDMDNAATMRRLQQQAAH